MHPSQTADKDLHRLLAAASRSCAPPLQQSSKSTLAPLRITNECKLASAGRCRHIVCYVVVPRKGDWIRDVLWNGFKEGSGGARFSGGDDNEDNK